MSTHIQQVTQGLLTPVSIERDMASGREIIVIEGVRFDADYFRFMATPNEDYLYAISSREDGSVWFDTIHNVAEAENFFDRVFLANAVVENEGEHDEL